MMIGWRTRLGVLVPSANIVLEPDMYRMIPSGVTAHFARVWIAEDSPEELSKMIDFVPKACQELAHALVDVYGFGCTSGSFIKGLEYDLKIIEIIKENTGKPATSVSTACIEGLRQLKISRISLATPYEEWLNEKQKSFFEENGIEVVQMKGLGTRNAEEIAGQDPGRIYRLAREVDCPESQAIFISCTDFRACEALEVIEKDTRKPALSSNQMLLRAMLKLANVYEPIKGYGSFLLGN
jgi:maleate cis-trans isomerase